MKVYRIYLSRAWVEHNVSQELAGFLIGRKDFDCRVYALPEDSWDECPSTDDECNHIYSCMQGCDIVLLMSNSRYELIETVTNEIRVARQGHLYPKPILAVKTGVVEGVSEAVKEAAKEVVEWDAEEIVKAIKRHVPV